APSRFKVLQCASAAPSATGRCRGKPAATARAASARPVAPAVEHGARKEVPAAMSHRPDERASAGAVAQSDASAAARTRGSLVYEFDPGRLERAHHLHQRLDDAADNPVARLHSLNGRKRDPGGVRKGLLLHADQRPCGSHLCRGQHRRPLFIQEWLLTTTKPRLYLKHHTSVSDHVPAIKICL